MKKSKYFCSELCLFLGFVYLLRNEILNTFGKHSDIAYSAGYFQEKKKSRENEVSADFDF